MNIMRLIILALLALTLAAEEPKTPTEANALVPHERLVDCSIPGSCVSTATIAPARPRIPLEHATEFWAAYARLLAATPSYEKLQADVEATKATLAKDCGEGHTWNVSVATKPTCDAKPAKPEAAKPTP